MNATGGGYPDCSLISFTGLNMIKRFIIVAVVGWMTLCASRASAQTSAPAEETKPFKPEELEALVAQIALYPDSLLSQILMAATYPLEVVQAQRWAEQHKDLKDAALTAELEKQKWDPSVKSLVNFPQVLDSMSKQLDWTTQLGDAFIADQKAVMDAVQRLRAKAQAAGSLKTTEQQKVVVEQAPQTVVVQGAPPQVIKIESPSPTVVYVPTYNPTVVYGTWPYPTYPPPQPAYPPGYVASNMLSFGLGVAAGAAWGYAWGGCNWHGGDVDIDVNRNTNINTNINRQNYQANIQKNTVNRTGTGTGTAARGSANSFQHDPSHRKGVAYRDPATTARNTQPGTANAAKAREDFRGRSDAGSQNQSRGGTGQLNSADRAGAGRNQPTAGTMDRGGTSDRAGAADRSSTGSRATPSATTSDRGGGAFGDSSRDGASARTSSDRGSASRSSSGSSSAGRSTGPGSGSRGGGGGGGRR